MILTKEGIFQEILKIFSLSSEVIREITGTPCASQRLMKVMLFASVDFANHISTSYTNDLTISGNSEIIFTSACSKCTPKLHIEMPTLKCV